MIRLYHLFTALFVTTLVLAACGGQPTAEDSPESMEASAPEAADPPSVEESTEAAEPMETAQVSDECEEGFRLFNHELLANEPTCIPKQPERVAYLTFPSHLYPFGVNPVSAWGLERDADNYPFIADWIREETVDHGLMPLNLEILIEQNPDLIIYSEWMATDILDELPEIAPTVLSGGDPSDPPTWQEMHVFFGAVFDQSALAEEQIAVYDQRVLELRTALENSLGDPGDITVSVVRLAAEDNISLQSTMIPSVAIIKDVGFDLPDAIDMSVAEIQETYNVPFGVLNISKEEIALADGDVLFVLGSPGGEGVQRVEGDQLINDMIDDPLWQSLRAFEANAVYGKGDVWMQGNILSAHLIIDDLAEIFEVEIVTLNPFLSDADGTN